MYKVIQNDKVIDVIRFPRFVKFLQNNHIAIADKSTANGIVGSDGKTVYSFTAVPNKNISVVSIEKITSQEFTTLHNLLKSGEDISADESSLAKAKRDLITRLSSICKNKINSGFSVVLSDGKDYSFRLTTEDQLNLMLLENQLLAGETQFIYHATNQPCRFFSREDISKIINTYKRYVLYHTTYFNTAKQYIKSLNAIDKVNLFTYGMDVSSVTKDFTIKQILKNGENL